MRILIRGVNEEQFQWNIRVGGFEQQNTVRDQALLRTPKGKRREGDQPPKNRTHSCFSWLC